MSRKTQANPVSLFAFQDIITAVMGIILLLVLLLSLCLVQLPDDAGNPNVTTTSLEEIETEMESIQQKIDRLEQSKNSDIKVDLMSEADLESEIKDLQTQVGIVELENIELKSENDKNKKASKSLDDQLKSKGPEIKRIQVLQTKVDDHSKQLKKLRNQNLRIYNFNSSSDLPWLVDLYQDKIMIAKAKSKSKPVVFADADVNTRVGNLIAWLNSEKISDQYFLLIARDKTANVYRTIKLHIKRSGGSIGTEIEPSDIKILDENEIPSQ